MSVLAQQLKPRTSPREKRFKHFSRNTCRRPRGRIQRVVPSCAPTYADKILREAQPEDTVAAEEQASECTGQDSACVRASLEAATSRIQIYRGKQAIGGCIHKRKCRLSAALTCIRADRSSIKLRGGPREKRKDAYRTRSSPQCRRLSADPNNLPVLIRRRRRSA